MRKLLIALLLFQGCHRNSIKSITSEPPGVIAVSEIMETSNATIALIDKYDSFLQKTDVKIQSVDSELSKMLLIQNGYYLILAQEKCPTDSTNKYWEAEFTFGTKIAESEQVKKTISENPDTIEVISYLKDTVASVLKLDQMERMAVLKSNQNKRMKLRIAFAEYKFQLSSIKTRKYDCNFRRSLFESYIFFIKFYFSVRNNV